MRKRNQFCIFLAVFIAHCSATPHHEPGHIGEHIETTTVTFQSLDDGVDDGIDATTFFSARKNEREGGGDITVVADDENIVQDSVGTTIATPESKPASSLPVFLKEPEIGASEYAAKEEKELHEFDLSKYKGITVKTFNDSDGNYYAGTRQGCSCGVPGRRIVGGENALIEEYPWTVVLYRRRFFWGGWQQYCGGTLINNYYILTASHCVDGMIASGIEVGIHDENIKDPNELDNPTEMIKVERIIMHSEYNRRSIDNDIALLKLEVPVIIGGVTVPACLPAGNDYLFVGQNATAAGWGATSSGGSTSDRLMKVHVPVISNEDCNETKYKGKITANMLCAGFVEEGQKDSCQGDSGGPLIIENGGRRTLIGVVSWGYGCAEPNSPGVYTRVGRYPEWILKNTVGAEWCSG